MRLIDRLPNESARDFALRALKYNIVNLYFPPGTVISCHDLAGRMGVSRTPLREAMQELDRIGLLTVYANAGSRISPIDYAQLNELRFIRQTMDSSVSELICERIRPEDYFALEEILRAQQNCLKTGQTDQLMELDNHFHSYLYDLAGMTTTYGIIGPFQCHFERFRRLSFSALYDIRLTDEHVKLFEALKKRDKRAARKLTLLHFSSGHKDELEIIGKYPEYFINHERLTPETTRGASKQMRPAVDWRKARGQSQSRNLSKPPRIFPGVLLDR